MRLPSRWIRASRVLEILLIVAGLFSLAVFGWRTLEMRRLEAENSAAVSRLLREHAVAREPPDMLRPPTAPGFVGELDIPRLHVSAAVRAGDDEEVLAGAIGYLPDTPPPWERGNTTLAAHRDRLFRALAGIRLGDDIFLWTTHGDFRYVVQDVFVVNPADVWVADNAEGVDLTLITCYPFVYVGHAPQRFVVRARKAETASASTYRN